MRTFRILFTVCSWTPAFHGPSSKIKPRYRAGASIIRFSYSYITDSHSDLFKTASAVKVLTLPHPRNNHRSHHQNLLQNLPGNPERRNDILQMRFLQQLQLRRWSPVPKGLCSYLSLLFHYITSTLFAIYTLQLYENFILKSMARNSCKWKEVKSLWLKN